MNRSLRLGTRGSPLALTQARMVAAALAAAHDLPPDAIEIVPVKTSGDRVQDRPLAEIGGKALWTKELDAALLDGRIDFAVHSMKDVETIRPAEITIAAMLPRADVRDRLIGIERLDDLPAGGRVGTSSPRRAAQVLRARPDAVIVPFRGNVDTRLRRIVDREAEATLLAAAGLDRLNRPDVGTMVPVDVMLPAPAQGAVGIEARAGDAEMLGLLAAINHEPTYRCVAAERVLLLALRADCHSPVAALATVDVDNRVALRAEIIRPDGAETVAGGLSLDVPDEAAPLAADLLGRASPALRALFAG